MSDLLVTRRVCLQKVCKVLAGRLLHDQVTLAVLEVYLGGLDNVGVVEHLEDLVFILTTLLLELVYCRCHLYGQLIRNRFNLLNYIAFKY